MRAYEGLFLVDDTKATDDFQGVADHIKSLLERQGASLEKLEKWDTRRLAYEIDHKRRGTYILTRFSADPARIADLTRDCRISNIIMRELILRVENVGVSLEEAEEKQRAQRRAQMAAEPAGAAGEILDDVPSIDDVSEEIDNSDGESA